MKVKKKILSLLLAIAMILGMLPMTALPVYAADATQIKIWNGTEMQTYTLGIDTLPNGLFWNSTDNRLELDGYNGGRIEQATSEDELTFYVVDDSTIDGGEETALRYSNPTIDGVAGKTLTLTGTDRSVMYITGSCTIKNITVKVDQAGTVAPNGHTTATNGNINVRENGRLEVELNKETDNPYRAQAVGNLRLYDNGSASITVTANNTKTTDAYGVISLHLNGTGDCDITVTNNGSGNTQAVQYEPNIYSSYDVTGAWNSSFVSYKAANPDTNADLSALTCDLGAVSPTFKANVTSYTGPNYSYNYNTAGITATVAETGASLKINGEAATSGVLKYVPIAVGENVIPVVVTSKDSSTTKTYTLTITRESGGSHNLTIVNGSKDPDTDTVEAGDTVTITANEPATGKVFDKWTTSDGVTFANASSATTTFVMPAKAVTVTATYKNNPETDTELSDIKVRASKGGGWENPALTPAFDRETRSYSLNLTSEYNLIYFYLGTQDAEQTITATVDGNALAVGTAVNGFNTTTHTLTKATTVFVFTITAKDGSTTGTYTVTVNRGSGITHAVTVTGGTTATPTPAEGDTVTITANEPATGKVFDKWTSEDGVTFANASSSTTTFTMPAKAVTVTATYKNDPDMDTELSYIKVNIKTPSTTWENPALTPAFDREIRSYSLNLTAEYKSIYFYLPVQVEGQTITATVDGNALTVNTAVNGFQTTQHTLTKATTVFDFTIKAKDGSTTGTYTVTVNRESGTTHAVTVTGGTTTTPTATAGDTVTITANEPAPGKVFDKWTTSDGVTFGDANSATTTFTMPAKAVTVTATYKDAPVTTYAVAVTGGTGSGNFAAGAAVSITANEPAPGKVFDKWTTTDGVTFGDVNNATTTFTMPAKDVTVTATYKDAPVTTYAVTVNSGTGGGDFAEGATVSITANAPATGKVFDKWTTTDGVTFANANTATTTFVMPAKAVTVTATYKDAPVTTYAVTVNSGTGGGDFAEGATVSITANAPATGKVFDKWTTTDGVTFANANTATTTFVMPAKAVTVTATYKDAPVTTYAVTVNSGTGGGDFAEGATVSITANAPATGKVFDKWTTTDGVTFANANTATTTFVMPAKAVTVTATYKDAPVTTYAVTVTGGTGSGNYAADATVSITANEPATGKVFDKWTTSDGVVFANANSANTTFTMPAKAVIVTATYKDAPVTTYAVTVIGGTGSGNYAADATVSITANEPATGKVFDKWIATDGVAFANANSATTTFVMPAKAVTVTATYKDAPVTTYAVTVTGGTTTTPTAAEGATVSITANEPATGKVFDKWIATDGVAFANSSSANTTFTMPAKAVTVTATYKDAPVTTYAVTVNSGTGSGNFATGATVSITANAPATGKVFDQWTTTDGVAFGDANTATTTFVMPAKAVTVTATYKDISSETPDYKIIAGENSIWKKGNTKGIVIISNGDYGDFTGVNVDGIFIDSSNYTSAAGSTVVTLKPAYLETLAVGTHIVTLQFGNYSVQTNLTILAADERPDDSKPNEEIPKTGDSNHTLPLIGLLLLSGSALIGVTRNKKKKKSYNK